MFDIDAVGEILNERREELAKLKRALDEFDSKCDTASYEHAKRHLDKLEESDLLMAIMNECLLLLIPEERMVVQ